MNSDDLQQASGTDERSWRRRRRTPPVWLYIVLAVLGAAVAVVRGTDVLGDHAFANIATFVLAFLAVVVAAVWFLLLSGYRGRTRLLALAGSVAGVTVFAVLFRLDRVSGELMPMFAYRFSARPDRLLEPPPESAAGDAAVKVDLRTTAEDDFPQFLGPHRDTSVEHVRLARDWTQEPPKLVWRRPIGAGWSAFSVVNGHAVTMEQRDKWEMVSCYGVTTGRLEWAYSIAARYERLEAGVGPRSTPTIDDGRVYALGARGHLACLDGASGRCLWEKDLLHEAGITPEDETDAVPWGRAASPLVVDDRVIVPLGGRKGGQLVSLAAYNKRDGRLLWTGGDQQISYSSPAVATLAGRRQVLIVNEDTLAGHDPETGRLLWQHPWPGHTNRDPNVSQAVPVPPNRVFASKGYGGGAILLGLDPADGAFEAKVVWRNAKVLRTKFANVAVRGGYVYGLSDGTLECVELATGRSQWKQGRYGHGQLLRAGDLLLVLSEDGEMLLLEATPDRPNNVLGRFQAIEGLTWNNFALYGPYLLVRNADEAGCYKLPLANAAPGR